MTTLPTSDPRQPVGEIVSSASRATVSSDPDRLRAQNFIRSLVDGCVFRPIIYDDMGRARLVDGQDVRPTTLLVNEISRSAEVDPKFGRSLRLRIFDWRFQLKMSFPKEVDTEDFYRIFREVPRLPRDEVTGAPQLTVVLKDANPKHPTTKRSSGGTRETIVLEVSPSRN